MAIILTGLYRVDVFQTYLNEICLNTFWYRETFGFNNLAQDLADEFDTTVAPSLAVIQNTGVVYDLIRVTPIFGNEIEVNKTPTTPAGLVNGTQMSTFVAVSIRLNRASTELRNGWKRFTGLVEELTASTTFAGSYVTTLQATAVTLSTVLTGVTGIYQPSIVRKPFSTKEQTPDWEAIDVGGATVLNRPTTQNSRKIF